MYVSESLRRMCEPDEFGRTFPLAVYGRMPGKGETVSRNQTVSSAEALAEAWAAKGWQVHVSVDTCG